VIRLQWSEVLPEEPARYQGLEPIQLPFPVGAMTSEGVDGSRSSDHFATVRYAPWNEIFFARIYRNPLSVDDERIATLYENMYSS